MPNPAPSSSALPLPPDTSTSCTTDDTTPTASKRVRALHIRELVNFSDTRELAQVMLDVVTAYKHLYEDAGILHGDINPNTIAICAFPGEPGVRAVGALVDCDEPLRTVKS
ncbi:hypothetical protein TRAPUB_5474 [Trametes pubescens]|uniref:Fungal-type protein kinase domain-containing protein n=1 Tax=Trametes pubescens TaxID=154538 RepID=A0A1M2V8C4_TRAPU|nr:hypothetical protein TRAPUB_5474 [Trametes pubescens]